MGPLAVSKANHPQLLGNGELDTVVSSRGKSKGCLATFVERFLRDTFKTYMVDRGKEFACYSKVEADLKVPVYFADAYSSWQIGSNENANGLLRENFLKKTDLAQVSEEEINEALFLINQRPRKCLGWKTLSKLFYEQVSHLY